MRKDNILALVSLGIAGFIAIGLIAGIKKGIVMFPDINTPNTSEIKGSSTLEEEPAESSLTQRISVGKKILFDREIGVVDPNFRDAKEKGIKAFAEGDYQDSVKYFEEAIKINKNAPETLIYLNNARLKAEAKESYTIAAIAPVGAYSESALKLLRGVAQAQNEINNINGINGVYLNVIIANDDDDPKIAQEVALELSKMSEVLGVIGHFSSGTSLAAAEIYDSEELVSISGVSTSTKLTNTSPYFFRTVPSDNVAARALADYMVTNLQLKKAAIVYDSASSYSLSLKNAFSNALDRGVIVEEFDLSNKSTFDASNSVTRSIKLDAEVIMLAAPESYIDKALNIIEVNNQRLKLLGGDAMYHKKILEIGGEEAIDMVVGVAWHIDNEQESNFVKDSRNLWGGDVDWNTSMTYDATQALIAALRQSNTRSGIQKALSSPDFFADGVSERIKFFDSGDRNGKIQLVKVKKVEPSRSGTGYDFVPES